MVYARVGLLRTLPPPDPRDVQRLHRTAHALGIDWPAELLYPDFIRSLDPAKPQHAAMISACTRLLRGSGYVAFDGETPAQPQHAALAAEYAHVTAPLRRLGDRYACEVCVALCAGDRGAGLGARRAARPAQDDAGVLPARGPLRAGGPRPGRGRRAAAPRRREFAAVVVEVDEKDPTRGVVDLPDPAVEAPVVSASDDAARHRRPGPAHDRRRGARKVEFTLE